jgi:hypothetical protein
MSDEMFFCVLGYFSFVLERFWLICGLLSYCEFGKHIMIQAGNKFIEGSELLGECKAAIQKVAPECEVVLFGSRARGDGGEYSDFDLLVLIDGPADVSIKERLVSEIYPFELKSEQMISLVVYNKQQWDAPPYKTMPLHLNIDREGIVI